MLVVVVVVVALVAEHDVEVSVGDDVGRSDGDIIAIGILSSKYSS